VTTPTSELTAEDRELIELARRIVDQNTDGVDVGNFGRGPVGPCGRDRQVLFDYYPDIRVILPAPTGIRSAWIRDLMPLGTLWTP
jgi:cytidine deaminase